MPYPRYIVAAPVIASMISAFSFVGVPAGLGAGGRSLAGIGHEALGPFSDIR